MNTGNLLAASAAVVALAFTGCAHHPQTRDSLRVDEVSPALAIKSPAPVVKPVSKPIPVAQAPRDEAKAVPAEAVLHFDFDSADLTEDSLARLRNLAPVLMSTPHAHVRIAGNCDERGTEEYNLALGQQRAEAAKRYLVALGVNAVQLATVSYGFERPAATGHDEQAWALNRRDDIAPTN